VSKFHLIHAEVHRPEITACGLRVRGSRGSARDKRRYRRPHIVGIGQFERFAVKARCVTCQSDLNKWRKAPTRQPPLIRGICWVIQRRVTQIGGSLGVIIPRDFAEAMDVDSKSKVRLTLVGRQLVIELDDDTIPEASFRRAFATVLRKYAPTFKALAEHDK